MNDTAFRRGVERTSADQKLRLTGSRSRAQITGHSVPVRDFFAYHSASTLAAIRRLAADAGPHDTQWDEGATI
jgi:hypothetical protein